MAGVVERARLTRCAQDLRCRADELTMSDGKPRKSADPLYLLLREGGSEEFNRRSKAGRNERFPRVRLSRRRSALGRRRQYRFFRLLLPTSGSARARPARLPDGRCKPARGTCIRCLLPAPTCTGRDRDVGASRHPNAPEVTGPLLRSRYRCVGNGNDGCNMIDLADRLMFDVPCPWHGQKSSVIVIESP